MLPAGQIDQGGSAGQYALLKCPQDALINAPGHAKVIGIDN